MFSWAQQNGVFGSKFSGPPWRLTLCQPCAFWRNSMDWFFWNSVGFYRYMENIYMENIWNTYLVGGLEHEFLIFTNSWDDDPI